MSDHSHLAGLDDVLRTVDLLYAAALDPQLWPAALDRLAEQVGGVGTAVVSASQVDGRALVSESLHELSADYVRHEWWKRDILRQEGIRRGMPTGLLTHDDIMSNEEMRRQPYFQEFLRKHGIYRALSYTAVMSPGNLKGTSVLRSIRKGNFEPQEQRLLGTLGPHVAHALRIADRIADADARAASLEGMLDRFAIAAVLIDRDGRVGAHNASALDACGRAFTIARGSFRATTGPGQKALDLLLKSVFEGGAAEPRHAHLPLHDGSPGFVARAFRLPRRIETPFCPSAWVQAVLYLIDAQVRLSDTGPADALKAIGLTPAEARVAAIIGVGFSPAEAADALNIKVSTVRLQLKIIFIKLGVRRQSELAHLVSRLMVVR